MITSALLLMGSATRAHADTSATLGFRASAPLGVSVSGTLVLGPKVSPGSCDHDARGVLVQAEAGAFGGQLAVGVGVSCVDSDHGRVFPWGAVGVSATVTRTWGKPWLATADSTYAGLKLDLAVFFVTARLGAGYRLSPGPDSRRWVVTFGAGVGF